MPAVTVENPLTLPRVAAPVAAPARPVLAVATAPSGFEGEGFPVRRAFAGIDYKHLDPFIMMDQMGEVEYAPGEPKDSISWGCTRSGAALTSENEPGNAARLAGCSVFN
ncbi:hypothetical protein [Streptomyces sp. bgisy084]|uniref:hypothetical protein n=1 Tax=Streptomyces sp. bgisy084 TaxID=3413777 RepID=UPI003D74EAC5